MIQNRRIGSVFRLWADVCPPRMGRNVYNRRCQPAERTTPNNISPNGALQNDESNAPPGLKGFVCVLPAVDTAGYRYFVPSGQTFATPCLFILPTNGKRSRSTCESRNRRMSLAIQGSARLRKPRRCVSKANTAPQYTAVRLVAWRK